jgi:hypothetical protein
MKKEFEEFKVHRDVGLAKSGSCRSSRSASAASSLSSSNPAARSDGVRPNAVMCTELLDHLISQPQHL